MIVRAKTEINEDIIRNLLNGEKLKSQKPSSYFFFNSGCSSLRFFLQLIGKGSRIGIQVFTCPTVLDAIYMAGCVPVFLDINPDYYTTRLDIVEKKIHEIDALLLTHLFGIPNPDYLAIKKLCKIQNVILVDDLCQTFHSEIGGNKLEDLSDNYFYSFFYDKPISSVSGGMLKVSELYIEKARRNYSMLPICDNHIGRKNLKTLLLMDKLLSPDMYKKEFRYGYLWKILLRNWPMGLNLNLLNCVVNSKWIKLLNKLCKAKRSESIGRLSEIEEKYILAMMESYHSNNRKLVDFYEMQDKELPLYLTNPAIKCSVSKRAIVGFKFQAEDMQIDLYNWSELICKKDDYYKYPGALSVLKSHVNIPCWNY